MPKNVSVARATASAIGRLDTPGANDQWRRRSDVNGGIATIAGP
jgi:hypothetical protein